MLRFFSIFAVLLQCCLLPAVAQPSPPRNLRVLGGSGGGNPGLPLCAGGAPTNLQAQAISGNVIKITWNDNSNDEEGFIVNAGNNNSGWSFYPGPNTTSFYFSGASSGSTVNISVQAVKNTAPVCTQGIGPVTASTTLVKPAPPNIVNGYSSSSGKVYLEWDGYGGGYATGYKVERSTLPTSGFVQVSTTTVDASASTLPPGTYYYQVKAFNTVGTSDPSQPYAVTIGSLPAAPKNLTADLKTVNSVQLDFDDMSVNEANFVIERSTFPTSNFAPIATWQDCSICTEPSVITGRVSYVDSSAGLVVGTTYYYQIKAVSSTGQPTGYTNIASVKIGPPKTPSVPKATIRTRGSVTGIELEFDYAPSADGYTLERSSTSPTSGFSVIVNLNPYELYTDSQGLVTDTIYYYQVRSHNAQGYSPYSPVRTIKFGLPTAAPSNISVQLLSIDKVKFNWTINANNGFRSLLERSLQGSGIWQELQQPPLDPGKVYPINQSWDAYGENTPGATYDYRVVTYNDFGTSQPSNVVSLTIPSFWTMEIQIVGTGMGQVRSDPAGIWCHTNCIATFLSTSTVTLQTIPNSGSVFSGFDYSGCPVQGSGYCLIKASFTYQY